MDKYYVDKVNCKLVRNIDISKFPKEYFMAYKRSCDNDTITEVWEDAEGKVLTYKWLKSFKCIVGHTKAMELKEQYFKNLDFERKNLICYTVPTKWYDEEVEKAVDGEGYVI